MQIYYNSFGDMNDSELFPSRGTCVLDGFLKIIIESEDRIVGFLSQIHKQCSVDFNCVGVGILLSLISITCPYAF